MKAKENKLVGAVLGGTYEITDRLGEGGMGTVYRAKHNRVPKEFAIKVLSEAVGQESEEYRRFRRECDISCKLQHQHIVTVLDFDLTEENRPFLVMECLEGEDLGERIARVGTLSIAETVAITE